MKTNLDDHSALVVVDLQRGFDAIGRANNPNCEANISQLVNEWRRRRRPIVFVRHDSRDPESPLRQGQVGNDFKPELEGPPDLLVTKQVHSAFYGQPDLDHWLRQHEIEALVVTGIATDHCCSTTARMAADLGYRVVFAIDATRTFDRRLPDGGTMPADQIAAAVAAELNNEFAEVARTSQILET